MSDLEAGIKDGDLPAFPTPDRGDGYQWPGMTLRDYFACAALAGGLPEARVGDPPVAVALAAYRIADAMLKERGRW